MRGFLIVLCLSAVTFVAVQYSRGSAEKAFVPISKVAEAPDHLAAQNRLLVEQGAAGKTHNLDYLWDHVVVQPEPSQVDARNEWSEQVEPEVIEYDRQWTQDSFSQW